MMTLEALRAEYPHAVDQIYLNHAATGVLSRRAVDAIDRYVRERHGLNIENYYTFAPVIEQTLTQIASLIGTDASRVEFVSNTSAGLSILAEGLPWREGDRVAVPGCEFPANVYPFLNLKDKGVEVDFIPHNEGRITLEDIERTLTEKTRLLSISWVQFLSGFATDLKAVSELCRRHNVLLSVDAIQGLGALTLDVEGAGVDFMSSGGHKWLMGMQGLGFIYVSPRAQELIRPVAGWMHGPVDWERLSDYDLRFHDSARRYRLGTLNSVGIAALNATLALYLDADPAWCERRLLGTAALLAERLDELGLEPYGRDRGQAPLSGIVTYRHPEADGMARYLSERRIAVSVRNGLLRFAPSYYHTDEEIAVVAEVVAEFLERRSGS